MRTRVKICGLSRAEDAAVAIACGADALGLIFFPPSPRAVDLNQAASLAASVPALVDLVGVFVDPTEAEVAAVLDRVPLTLLQFHGDETREQCEAYGTPYIKAVRMRDEVQLETLADQHPNARAFLLDTYHPKAVGGTGAAFDWTRARIELSAPVILAGGLEAHNVGEALTQSGAWAVDVSTGVESEPGRKCAVKMLEFCKAVRAWDTQGTDPTVGGDS